jgi:undecaprenyl-diphosphatase
MESARRWQWRGLVAGSAAFLWVAFDDRMHGPLFRADARVYDRVSAWDAAGYPVHALGEAVSRPASVPWAIALTALAAVAWWLLGARRWAVWAAASGLAVAAAITLLKQGFRRELPPLAAGAWYGYSFPSGHTVAAVANVGVLFLLGAQVRVDRRRLGPARARATWRWAVAAWAALSLATGVARILTQRHWASDVYASWGLGTALACATLLLARIPAPAARHEGGSSPKTDTDAPGAPPAGAGGGPAPPAP